MRLRFLRSIVAYPSELYLDRIPLGAHEIAYAARTCMATSLDEEGVSRASGPLQLAIVRKIKPNEAGFRKFVPEARKLTGAQNCVGRGAFG